MSAVIAFVKLICLVSVGSVLESMDSHDKLAKEFADDVYERFDQIGVFDKAVLW